MKWFANKYIDTPVSTALKAVFLMLMTIFVLYEVLLISGCSTLISTSSESTESATSTYVTEQQEFASEVSENSRFAAERKD